MIESELERGLQKTTEKPRTDRGKERTRDERDARETVGFKIRGQA